MNRNIFFLIITVALVSCGKTYKKPPVDKYIVSMDDYSQYSIILHDMDVQGTFFKNYLHKYKIIYPKDTLAKPLAPHESRFEVIKTEWVDVGEKYFWANENNLGMTLASKSEDGKITRSAHPPGYNYVGNSKYGHWRTGHDGTRFWEFYGQWMFMSHMFGMMHRPVYYREYEEYRGNYYGRRSYYGEKNKSGQRRYGTNSAYTKQSRPDFHQRKSAKNGWTSSRSRTSSGSRGWGRGK